MPLEQISSIWPKRRVALQVDARQLLPHPQHPLLALRLAPLRLPEPLPRTLLPLHCQHLPQHPRQPEWDALYRTLFLLVILEVRQRHAPLVDYWPMGLHATWRVSLAHQVGQLLTAALTAFVLTLRLLAPAPRLRKCYLPYLLQQALL